MPRYSYAASEEKADILLADVPCSGLGVIGRKPDIRYKMTEKKQEDIVKLQRQILDTVWKYVKVGGTLVYSTCTIGAEENQYNLKWFLDNYPFKLESIDPYLPEELQGKTTRAGYLQLLPGIHESRRLFPGQIKEGIRMMEKTDIRSLNLEELKAWFKERGEKPFRAGQLYQWMHQKLAGSFDEMTNLSKGLREKLAGETEYTVLKPVEILTSEIDGTQKYLFELKDGNVIESVLMKYHHGNSVCISSQVGCRMGCRFCASTIGGTKRDLTAIGDAGGGL